MKFFSLMASFVLASGILLSVGKANAKDDSLFWMKLRATDKYQRSTIANAGISIETTREDFVVATGDSRQKKSMEALGLLEVSFPLMAEMDFPTKDAAYHNYSEMLERLSSLTAEHSQISRLFSIGKSKEGRDIWAVRISGNLEQAGSLPAAIFMGGHHAREHLSVELPIFYIEYLLTEYAKGNARIQGLVDGRDIHIIPMVNPDGAEYDISTGKYKMWRKNRAVNDDGSYGVDLNRNYGFGWGGSGASTDPTHDTYRGPQAFSEPESLAIKNYVEQNENITVLLSFHTYSQLILYPWGHVYDSIAVEKDKLVHETMAQKMAEWNGYTPQQSSELYVASGDTTDWSYGEHKIISFTFELDPGSSGWGSGGFYPGAGVISQVQRKNLEPVLYLIEYADNPYRSIDAGTGPIFRP